MIGPGGWLALDGTGRGPTTAGARKDHGLILSSPPPKMYRKTRDQVIYARGWAEGQEDIRQSVYRRDMRDPSLPLIRRAINAAKRALRV